MGASTVWANFMKNLPVLNNPFKLSTAVSFYCETILKIFEINITFRLQMGYGKRAMQQLVQYYSGNITNLSEEDDEGTVDKVGMNGESAVKVTDKDLETNLLEETIKPRKNLPPLLLKLNERRAEKLDYLGVSYGLTPDLLRYDFMQSCKNTANFSEGVAIKSLSGVKLHSTKVWRFLCFQKNL